jgi:predicted aspartyl protease
MPVNLQTEVLLGETCYRRADFDGAASHFTAALQSSSAIARAYLGLAKLDQLQSRRAAARARIERAYSLDPNDPEIMRAYAALALTPADEIAVLQRYIGRGPHESRKDLETAIARIQVLSRLNGRKTAILSTPYAPYKLKLLPWVPTAGFATGILLKISINGSRPLLLALDTGANGIYVSRKAVEKLQLENLVDAAVTGLGEGRQDSRLALAETVQIGELGFRNCPVYVTRQPITDWADGVIGASFFERFLLRLDARRQTLELSPYPGAPPEAVRSEDTWKEWGGTVSKEANGDLPFYRIEDFVVVPTLVNRRHSGYFVLDTGAAHTVVDSSIAATECPTDSPKLLALAAPGGEIRRAASTGLLRFQFGGHEFTDTDVATFDFATVSDSCGVRISGLLGYPLLRRSVLRINYRDGLLGVEQ